MFNQLRNIHIKTQLKNYSISNVYQKYYKHTIGKNQIPNLDAPEEINTEKNNPSNSSVYNKKPHNLQQSINTSTKAATTTTTTPAPAIGRKYEIFKDNSVVIFDVEEERLKFNEKIGDGAIEQLLEQTGHEESKLSEIYDGLNLERGINGVFEIEDLVDVLKRNNSDDIFVCSVPKEMKYVEFMCIVSGRSYRHMLGIANFVRKMYKIKCNKMDILPKIEGEKSNEWMALDLGNIALHIFSPTTREKYDLETLWTVGPKYDDETNKQIDPLIDLYERHSVYLKDLTPKANSNNNNNNNSS